MKRNFWLVLFSATLLLSCGSNSSNDSSDNSSSGGGGGGGGGGTFTAAQIVKAWVSNCMPSTDARLGTNFYKNYLTLYANGSFKFQQYLHTGTGGSDCNNANYVVVMTIYGAYSVGAVISGSAQALLFAVNVTNGSNSEPDLLITNSWNNTPSVTQVQNAFNDDCGGTSPYCALSSGTCTNNGTYSSGQHADSQYMSCMNYDFPNTGTDLIYNIGEYSGGVLTLGAGVTGVPGVFSQGALPGSVSVTYY